MQSSTETTILNVSRRKFLKQLGIGSGALVLATALPGLSPVYAADNLAGKANYEVGKAEHALNIFVSLDTDGTTSIVCHRSEMGQGIRTTVPQIIADEMQALWSNVFVVQGQADKAYGQQNTAGSSSIRGQFTRLRQIGAAVRHMLEQAAANQWQVAINEVTANQHVVINNITGEKLSFGELAIAASQLEAPELTTMKLKDIKDFNYIGKEVKLFDLEDIVAGEAIYSHDVQLPNMLIASIQRPPVVGGVVKSFDDAEAKKVTGVVAVIQLKPNTFPFRTNPLGGVAVLAKNTWAAQEGRKKLKIVWDNGEHASYNTANFSDELIKKVNQPGKSIRSAGDVYAHTYDPDRTVEATYSVPHINHSPMETEAATAWLQGKDKSATLTIWAGTQNPQGAQNLAAKECGIDVNQVTLNIPLMGGAFGRKSKPDFILEAVQLAKQVNVPVKVIWTREDDIKHGFYHSISANYMKAELVDQSKTEHGSNKVADYWIQRVAYPPIGWLFNGKQTRPNANDLSLGFADTPFQLDNLQYETQEASSHVRPGWVRAVSDINNGFAQGSFVDELAVKANMSARQMWLELLGSDRYVDLKQGGFKYNNAGLNPTEYPVDTKRLKDTLNLVCDKANVEEKTAQNEAWGISVIRSFGSYVAAATKVRVVNKQVKILEMHTAIDCGITVTPDRVIAQMEGAMVFSLSITLMGGISVKDGAVEQSNFHDSPVTRMNQSPPMFVHLVESEHPPGGVGEPGIPPIIPSITNAIYRASGIRIRHLPVNKELSV
ncbi:molybdopterin-dependent oxidoreductase [Colwellia sp. C2M11]|nr:molybdopterin-dependent oxidoreductase [Colwellia sp. C2M11]